MAVPIQSTKNPLIRRFRDVARGRPPGLMIAEGRRLVGEAVAAGLTIVEAAWSPKLLVNADGETDGEADGRALLARLTAGAQTMHECSDRVLERLSSLASHQGVSVLLRRPAFTFEDLLGRNDEMTLIVVAAGVRDPGNLGALVRSAEAAGATGLITVEGSADPFRDKALRGSAGSMFRLPVVAGMTVASCLKQVHSTSLRLVVAEGVPGAVACWDVDFTVPMALVVGAEAAGVPAAFAAAADLRVVVPLAASVESLNVSVAAGIVLFEARRQRR